MHGAGDPALWWMLPGGALIGAWAGLSGYAGWPIVFPVLYVVLGRPLFECLVATLFVDWANAAVASCFYWARREPVRGTALIWGIASGPLAALGALLGLLVMPRIGGLLGAGAGPIALVIGLGLAVRASRTPAVEPPAPAPRPASPVRRTLFGAGMVLNATAMGFIGQGGAFNGALLMMAFRGASTRAAVSTGLLVSALALPFAFATYVASVPHATRLLVSLAPFAATSATAAGLAAWRTGGLPERRLAFLVAGCVGLAGAAATFQRCSLP